MSEAESVAECESVVFLSGKLRLKGMLHLPAGVEKPPVVIGSHGLFSSAASPKQIALAKRCNRYGIAFFRFDHRGCGESEGNFEEVTSLKARCEDIIAAVRTISARDDVADRIGLFGSSFGGSACLSVARQLKAAAVVTLAAPIHISSSTQIIEIIKKTLDDAERLIGDGKKLTFDISDKIEGISHLLLFHGDDDRTVPSFHALKIYEAAKMPKKIIMLKGGDHQLSDPGHQKQFLQEASLWFKTALINKRKN